MAKKTLRVCPRGHQYYKSTDCATCPVCEAEAKPRDGFLAAISAPARRALQAEEIHTLKQLSKYSEKEILSLHGIGPGAMPKLRFFLKEEGLSFKNEGE